MNIEISPINFNILKIIPSVIYIVIGIFVYYFIKRIIINSSNRKTKLKLSQQSRIKTINTLILNVIKYSIVIIVILAVLAEFGVNVKSIVAGLGIGTAIIGLAFQDIAKDLIAGFSIITDGEYELGDTIEVDGFIGEVIFIGLRTTRIRDFKGATKIISNHYMDNIINYSVNNSLAIVDVGISYEDDQEKIDKVFEGLFKRLNGNIPNATKDLELWGVNDLADSAVVYRVVVETQPMKHKSVERFLRKEIKIEFDKHNIKIPYQQIEVHNGK